MKRVLLISALSVSSFGFGGHAQAQNYPWCAYYNTGDQAVNCGFVSREQCMATVSGIGGFCMPNNTYQPSPSRRR